MQGICFCRAPQGSGKTHTLLGDVSCPRERGVVPRAVAELARGIAEFQDCCQFKVGSFSACAVPVHQAGLLHGTCAVAAPKMGVVPCLWLRFPVPTPSTAWVPPGHPVWDRDLPGAYQGPAGPCQGQPAGKSTCERTWREDGCCRAGVGVVHDVQRQKHALPGRVARDTSENSRPALTKRCR